MPKIIGFTGTQLGMSEFQKLRLFDVLSRFFQDGSRIFHHGDCIGADDEAHEIAYSLNYLIVVHPPINDIKRAFCGKNCNNYRVSVLQPKEYLERNTDIVKAADILIAAPKSKKEVWRSGTWSTVRKARKLGKKVIII